MLYEVITQDVEMEGIFLDAQSENDGYSPANWCLAYFGKDANLTFNNCVFANAGQGGVGAWNAVNEFTVNNCKFYRITSYNVCYTKLLRSSRKHQAILSSGRFILPYCRNERIWQAALRTETTHGQAVIRIPAHRRAAVDGRRDHRYAHHPHHA